MTAINQGRIWNKNVIIDIMAFASEDSDPLSETEAFFHSLSQRHRHFMPLNHSWYPTKLTSLASSNLIAHSVQFGEESVGQHKAEYLHSNILLATQKPFRTSKLLYRATRDSWEPRQFHSRCDRKGATLIVFTTASGNLSAAFTTVPWSSIDGQHADEHARLFTLTGDLRHFTPMRNAVTHNPKIGPEFGDTVSLLRRFTPSKPPNPGRAYGKQHPKQSYTTETDDQGRNVLTGSLVDNKWTEFTCTEVEVFLLQ